MGMQAKLVNFALQPNFMFVLVSWCSSLFQFSFCQPVLDAAILTLSLQGCFSVMIANQAGFVQFLCFHEFLS